MTVFDDKFLPLAKTLVAKYGKTVVFHVKSSQNYNPDTGQVIEAGQDVSVKITPPSPNEDRAQDTDGTTVVSSCKTFLPAQGLTFTPDVGMEVSFDELTWKITISDPIYSGELKVGYTLTLER